MGSVNLGMQSGITFFRLSGVQDSYPFLAIPLLHHQGFHNGSSILVGDNTNKGQKTNNFFYSSIF